MTNEVTASIEPEVSQPGKSEVPDSGQPKSLPAKPKKVLPPARLSFKSQIEILTAYPAASGADRKAVSLKELGKVASMHPNTVTMVNPFLSDVGLLIKHESGGYVPSKEVFDYASAREWDANTAGKKLAPVLANSWFAKEILSKLSFRPMEEQEVLHDWASAASASREYEPNLKLLAEYLEFAGLIIREGTKISKPPSTMPPESKVNPKPPKPGTDSDDDPESKKGQSVHGGTVRQLQNIVNFSISIDVDMAKMGTWKPDRIASFFTGLAQVISASKSDTEE